MSAKGNKNARILSDVSCTVPAGKVTLILGESGAGKTTLLNALAGRAAAYADIEGVVGVHGRWMDASMALGKAGREDCDSATFRD